MALLGPDGNEPPKRKAGSMIEKQCLNPQCNYMMTLLVPKMEVVNAVAMSCLLFPHEDMQSCENCGTQYQFRLAGLGKQGLVFGFVAVEEAPQPGNRIITLPPGTILPDA